MKIIKNILINGQHQKPILTDLFYKKNNTSKPVVIFAHGYKGFKDWGAWNLMAEKFAENDCLFVKFNFSHNGGTVKQPIDFPDLEAFGNNNFIIELDDLQSVIDSVLTNKELENEINVDNITLIGHSRGGGIAILKANEDARITTVITLGSVCDFGARFPKGVELEGWEKQNVAHVFNSRTHQQMPHKYQFYENFKANETRLTIKTAVENLSARQLIIHGKNDETVPLKEAENLHQWNPKSELFTINHSTHTFNASHSWQKKELPESLSIAVEKSLTFIKK